VKLKKKKVLGKETPGRKRQEKGSLDSSPCRTDVVPRSTVNRVRVKGWGGKGSFRVKKAQGGQRAVREGGREKTGLPWIENACDFPKYKGRGF